MLMNKKKQKKQWPTFSDDGHHFLAAPGQELSALFSPDADALDALLETQLQIADAVAVIGLMAVAERRTALVAVAVAAAVAVERGAAGRVARPAAEALLGVAEIERFAARHGAWAGHGRRGGVAVQS